MGLESPVFSRRSRSFDYEADVRYRPRDQVRQLTTMGKITLVTLVPFLLLLVLRLWILENEDFANPVRRMFVEVLIGL